MITDAHCHVSCGEATVRELLIGRDFVGLHPWAVETYEGTVADLLSAIERALNTPEHPAFGVGEIGLDRLKDKNISLRMREFFEAQLSFALTRNLPVVLHGAKCWGQVVEAVKRLSPPGCKSALLFHGFSRSDGLIPDIVALNGYISVGPAILNDHAVNYRKLVMKIPRDRLLIETDRDEGASQVSINDVAQALAVQLKLPLAELISLVNQNFNSLEAKFLMGARTFLSVLPIRRRGS